VRRYRRDRPPDRPGGQRSNHVRGRLPRAADQLRALSDRLKAPLIHSVKGKDIMPTMTPMDGRHRHDRH